MADATIDSLSIQINTDSGNAVRGLNRISKALENLGKITESIKGLDGVNSFLGNLKELNGFTMNFNGLSKATNNLASANIRASRSYIDLWARLRIGYGVIRGISNTIGDFITKASNYTEDMNLFTVSMGKYAGEAFQYAETAGDAMGIDEGKWARNQGIFMSMTTGFGVASDRAYEMSKNLTQLGYDYASFFNYDVETAMQKLTSGLAGQTEPLLRLGVDLSQAKLEAVALSLGITKSFRAMNQAEKSQLRYYAMMTQLTHVQGDMARTLESPSNMLRVLRAEVEKAGRAIGQLFIPMLQTVLPYLIATARVVRDLAVSIASIVGIEIAEISSEGMGKLTDGTNEAKDSLDEASESANKFKNVILGFDELNVLTQSKNQTVQDSLGGWKDFELPTYDFLSTGTESRVKQIVEDMKEWLGITGKIDSWGEFFDTRLGSILKTVGAIAGAFLLFKFTDSFTTVLNTLSGLTAVTKLVSVALAISSLKLLWDGIQLLTDTDESNNLLGTVKTGIGAALMGASLGLMSGKGLGFSLGMSLIFPSVALGFIGVKMLLSDDSKEVFKGAMLTSISGMLGGAGVALDLAKSGHMTLGMNLGFAIGGLSLFFSGMKLMSSSEEGFSRITAGIMSGLGLSGVLAALGVSGGALVVTLPLSLIISVSIPTPEVVDADPGELPVLARAFDKAKETWDNTHSITKTVVSLGKNYANPDDLVSGAGSLSKNNAPSSVYLDNKKKQLIAAYASGGFPESGQFFIARENGAEMVGSIGNRTAVANNDQIVEAIERGVERAMGRSGNGGNWTIQIVDTDGNVKSETIISAAERRNRRDGKTVIPIGV